MTWLKAPRSRTGWKPDQLPRRGEEGIDGNGGTARERPTGLDGRRGLTTSFCGVCMLGLDQLALLGLIRYNAPAAPCG